MMLEAAKMYMNNDKSSMQNQLVQWLLQGSLPETFNIAVTIEDYPEAGSDVLLPYNTRLFCLRCLNSDRKKLMV